MKIPTKQFLFSHTHTHTHTHTQSLLFPNPYSLMHKPDFLGTRTKTGTVLDSGRRSPIQISSSGFSWMFFSPGKLAQKNLWRIQSLVWQSLLQYRAKEHLLQFLMVKVWQVQQGCLGFGIVSSFCSMGFVHAIIIFCSNSWLTIWSSSIPAIVGSNLIPSSVGGLYRNNSFWSWFLGFWFLGSSFSSSLGSLTIFFVKE